MKPDAFLPVEVRHLPIGFVMQPGGRLREGVAHAVSLGVVRVIAGATECHVIVDVKRPYYRGLPGVTA